MKNNNQQGSAHIIGVVTVIIILLGTLGFLLINNYQSHTTVETQQQSQEETTSEDTSASKPEDDNIAIMQSKVAIGMPRAEVDAKIGKPYKCTAGVPTEEEKIEYKMDSCLYGSPENQGSFNIDYINDKIWGTTYVKNP